MLQFVKIQTDDETRWINLAAVARATLAPHGSSGTERLAIYFSSAVEECTFKIEGNTKANAEAIRVLKTALDLEARPA